MVHIPEYIEEAEKIKAGGADEIIAMSVNDPFVMTAFAERLGGKHLINFAADGNGEFTQALGVDMDLSVAQLGMRSKRFSAVIKRNTFIEFNNEESPKMTEKSQACTIVNQIGSTR